MSEMRIIHLDTVGSTSSYLASLGAEAAHGTVVMAREQTAGRGQRGNSWEAEPGMNITLSLMLHPKGLPPARQFVISRAVSLAIVGMLDKYVDDVTIKWPNDIYIGDRKICGILIENTITGSTINRCIVGIGLNVNQTEFRSDAPNPVSLCQLMHGTVFDIDSLAEDMVSAILRRVDEAVKGVGTDIAEESFALTDGIPIATTCAASISLDVSILWHRQDLSPLPTVPMALPANTHSRRFHSRLTTAHSNRHGATHHS